MLSADDARKFLARIFDFDSQTEEQQREAYIHWKVQSEIMKGARAGELAELTAKAIWANPTNRSEILAEADAIVAAIHAAIVAELEKRAAEGQEMPWAMWPK
jgi:hypothetical protein